MGLKSSIDRKAWLQRKYPLGFWLLWQSDIVFVSLLRKGGQFKLKGKRDGTSK
jgi:hypothetical protein